MTKFAQPPLHSVMGRGQRIKAAERHYNIKCVDTHGTCHDGPPPTPPAPAQQLSLEDYLSRFDEQH